MKITLNLGGQTVEVEKMDVAQIVSEPWSVYKLDDGTIVKVKLVVSDIYKLPTPDPLTGLPQLLVKSGNVMTVEPAASKGDVH